MERASAFVHCGSPLRPTSGRSDHRVGGTRLRDLNALNEQARQAVAGALGPAYARPVGDPRALIDRLTAAQNAHDLEGMLACFHEDYRSEQPLFPVRTFQGIDQVRANWSALLQGIPDFHAEVLRSAVDGDTIFVEIHWTGTKADGTPFEERGVLIVGIRDDRIAWGRLYADEVEREGADIDAVVRRMAGTEDR
jgi:ketosteroid isomerase-like protein